ncbi:MAG: thioredoxin [Erysipelotrichaceae bacterium]|nr:thioredoxin [Erysipelotrichaceae bacterium]
MKQVNTEEFNTLIQKDAVLIDFFATWCGPCKMLSPVLESISEKMEGKCEFAKVDIDQSMDLAQKYGIMAVPTVILFKKGEKAAAFSGYQPEPKVMEFLQNNL